MTIVPNHLFNETFSLNKKNAKNRAKTYAKLCMGYTKLKSALLRIYSHNIVAHAYIASPIKISGENNKHNISKMLLTVLFVIPNFQNICPATIKIEFKTVSKNSFNSKNPFRV